jgi:hypothetical protein
MALAASGMLYVRRSGINPLLSTSCFRGVWPAGERYQVGAVYRSEADPFAGREETAVSVLCSGLPEGYRTRSALLPLLRFV